MLYIFYKKAACNLSSVVFFNFIFAYIQGRFEMKGGWRSFQYLVFIWMSCLSSFLRLLHLKISQQLCSFCGPGVCSPRCARSCWALTALVVLWEQVENRHNRRPPVLMTLQQPCRSAEVRGERGSGGFPAHTGRSEKSQKLRCKLAASARESEEELVN